jgi:DNA-binding GntR family transcriptional regulator
MSATTSLARDVRDRLLRAMRAGAYPEGRLPPEADLARELGVSRATVRAALQTLAEDGVVSRRRRHGTLINARMLERAVPLNRLLSFRELVDRSGYAATVDPLVRRIEPPAPAAAGALRLAREDPCLVVERLLRADGRPVVVVTDTLALTRLRVAPEDVPDADSTFAFVAEATGETVDHSVVTIAPCVATRSAPAHLELPAGTPYTSLEEVLFSSSEEPVAFSRITVDARRLPLTLVRQGR